MFAFSHFVLSLYSPVYRPGFMTAPDGGGLVFMAVMSGIIVGIMEEGLNHWNKFLKKGGYVAVTDATWFTEERPKEIFDFWNDAYPEIDTIPNKIAQMQKAGYVVVATFILPEVCWTENFFEPAVATQKAFLDKYKGNASAEQFIEYEKRHAALYEKYKDYYGYVFYIGKKR